MISWFNSWRKKRSSLSSAQHQGQDSCCSRVSQLSLLIKVGMFLFAFILVMLPFSRIAYAEDNEVNPQQLPDGSYIYDGSIIDISRADSYYEGQVVQVVGEVVGDSLVVDMNADYRWITLLAADENSNATVTIYMNAVDTERIDTFGKYGSTGTMLRVKGVYHLACSEHAGASDIHAEQVFVVSPGETHLEAFDIQDFYPGIGAVVMGLILLIAFAYMREKRR